MTDTNTVTIKNRSYTTPGDSADDEMLRLNGGVWPDSIETKNNVILPQAIEAISQEPNAIFFNSYMTADGAISLRSNGFRAVLLQASEPELRRRDAQRLAAEG